MKSFLQAQKYLYSLIPQGDYMFPGETGLKRTRALLSELNNPQSNYITVHVAGTSGKGSTATMIAKILEAAGYKIGLTVSPHIVSIHERMQINSQPISDDDFAEIVFALQPHVETVSQGPLGQVSYFEVLMAAIFEYFSRQKVDIAVIETGLGGTYDATNVINSLISVITPIGYDHVDILGNTLTEIAGNKAGIIKSTNRVVVSAQQVPEADAVLRAKAHQEGVVVVEEGDNFVVENPQVTNLGTSFDYSNSFYDISYKNIQLGMMGEHQAHNAAVAITAALELNEAGYEINEKIIRKALGMVRIPGRLEVIETDGKTFILDGAHNEEKMRALAEALAKIWPGKQFTVIFASKKDKDIVAEAKILLPFVNKLLATRYTIMMHAGKYSALEPQEISSVFKKAGFDGEINSFSDPKKALEKIKKGEVVLITGSLYLVSELRSSLVS